MGLNPRDYAYIRATGRDIDRVFAQYEILERGPNPVYLLRPCVLGDGIRRLDRSILAALSDRHRQAAVAGRVMSFVPASGAASRMLGELHALAEADEAALTEGSDLSAACGLVEGLRDSALWLDLGLGEGVSPVAIARAVVERYVKRPKALLPFHLSRVGVRTALEDHLREAASLTQDAYGQVRVHFTVAKDHLAEFEQAVAAIQVGVEAATGASFWVDLSVQDPATETISLGDNGEPYREDGHVVFRPGGHGALLANLGRCDSDVVLVKNIDNIVADHWRPEVVAWREALSGYLLELQDRAHALLRKLDAGVPGVEYEAMRFLIDKLGHPEPPPIGLRAHVIDRLARPLRVCAMVPNSGQVGGGPYFVEGEFGPQIIEQVEMNIDDPEQAARVGASTHFNPVDMALGLRDHRGVPFDLLEFSDPQRPLVTRKRQGGAMVTALELPGLWNGSMAGWNSVFIEVPSSVFRPVKTLSDLLDEAHRPR